MLPNTVSQRRVYQESLLFPQILPSPHHRTCVIATDSYDAHPCETAAGMRAGDRSFSLSYHLGNSLAQGKESMSPRRNGCMTGFIKRVQRIARAVDPKADGGCSH